MGCCSSSPHARRKYYDPADLDEEFVLEEDIPLRTFGKFRGHGVVVPDDIDGLPSTRILHKLATDPDTLLYEAEIDNGWGWRCFRPSWCLVPVWPYYAYQAMAALVITGFTCDEVCCWVRKEYSTRTYYRVYPNRIEINNPKFRIPWGCLGCGSWNGDNVVSHPFDRGAFGFHRVQFGVVDLFCCMWPCNGDSVARQRCQCNGPIWHGGWWCDEWPCDMLFCTFRYAGLADGDEVAFASNIALQAYFEGRKISSQDMEECLNHWRKNISEYHNPVNRKKDVMCEKCCRVPCINTSCIYRSLCQRRRNVPFNDERATKEIKEVYDKYDKLRGRQIEHYTNFKHPARLSTVCRILGCRRVCGRKGIIFCTEGCNDNKAIGCCYKNLEREADDPFPPVPHPEIDDVYDAARVMQIVLGNPPRNVVYKRWEWDSTERRYVVPLHVLHASSHSQALEDAKQSESSSSGATTENLTGPLPSHPTPKDSLSATSVLNREESSSSGTLSENLIPPHPTITDSLSATNILNGEEESYEIVAAHHSPISLCKGNF